MSLLAGQNAVSMRCPSLVVRRNLVVQAARLRRRRFLQLLAQVADIALQLLDLLLLAEHRAVERVEQIFGETNFRLELVQAGFHDALRREDEGAGFSPLGEIQLGLELRSGPLPG